MSAAISTLYILGSMVYIVLLYQQLGRNNKLSSSGFLVSSVVTTKRLTAGFNFLLFSSVGDGAFLALNWELVSTIQLTLEYLTATLPVGNAASLGTLH